MKRFFTIIALSALSFSVCFAQKETKNIVPGSAKDVGSAMPEIKVVDAKGDTYTDKDFKDHHNFFVFLFSPTCGHCMKMARIIGGHHELFKHNHVLFMAAPQMLPYFNNFFKQTSLNEFPQVVVGVDSADFITQVYTYSSLPQINIYDKHRKLIKVFHGDTPVDSLKHYLN